MTRGLAIRAAVALGGLALLQAAPAGAQTLTNGSFENFGGCGVTSWHQGCNNGSDYSHQTQQLDGTLYNGGTGGTYPGWSTSAGYAFILTPSQANNGFTGPAGPLSLSPTNNPGHPITSSPDGGSFFAVDPSYNYNSSNGGSGNGALVQQVTGLATGQTYVVSFYQAAAQQAPNGGNNFNAPNGSTETWSLMSKDSNNHSMTASAPSLFAANHDWSGWVQASLSFVATTATMTLSFLAQSNLTSAQPPFALLDGITMAQQTQTTQNVPEPPAAALLLAGLAGMGILGRRRARARS